MLFDMNEPTVTDWIQALVPIAAILLSLWSLIWQWRTSRRANKARLTCEALRVGPAVWRLTVSYEADDRSAAPVLKLAVRNAPSDLAIVSAREIPRQGDGQGGFKANTAAIFDLLPSKSLEAEMRHELPPSHRAQVEVFVRNPTEESGLKIDLSVKRGGRVVLKRRGMAVTPVA